MVIDDTMTQEIVGRVVGVTAPERIILFGSAAAGEMTGDSDVDLLVVVPHASNAREESVRIGNALRGLGFPFDVIVMAAERFEETKNVIGGVAYPVNKYGKVIYEAA